MIYWPALKLIVFLDKVVIFMEFGKVIFSFYLSSYPPRLICCASHLILYINLHILWFLFELRSHSEHFPVAFNNTSSRADPQLVLCKRVKPMKKLDSVRVSPSLDSILYNRNTTYVNQPQVYTRWWFFSFKYFRTFFHPDFLGVFFMIHNLTDSQMFPNGLVQLNSTTNGPKHFRKARTWERGNFPLFKRLPRWPEETGSSWGGLGQLFGCLKWGIQ